MAVLDFDFASHEGVARGASDRGSCEEVEFSMVPWASHCRRGERPFRKWPGAVWAIIVKRIPAFAAPQNADGFVADLHEFGAFGKLLGKSYVGVSAFHFSTSDKMF